jgi:hypothetical protein
MRRAQECSQILPTRVVGCIADALLTAPRQAEAMIPGDPLQAEQSGSATDPDDGMAVVQDAHQSGSCSRIELDPDDGQRPPGGLDERSRLAGHLNAFVDEQGIDRSRIAAASRRRAISAETGGAGH